MSREQVGGESERVTNAEAKLEVQLAGERQLEECGMGDSSSHPSPVGAHPLNWEVREQVVEPFVRDPNGK